MKPLYFIIGAIAFIGILVYLTIGQKKFRAEVCVAYLGRTDCRTASAATKQQAQRTATENACAVIASGMTDSIACANTPPTSVKWLD
jgi:hypothetical protein